MCVYVCAYTNIQVPIYLNILNFNDTCTYTEMNTISFQICLFCDMGDHKQCRDC